jgi:hypothetical protein
MEVREGCYQVALTSVEDFEYVAVEYTGTQATVPYRQHSVGIPEDGAGTEKNNAEPALQDALLSLRL